MVRIQVVRNLGKHFQFVPDGLQVFRPLEQPQPGASLDIALDVPGHPLLKGIVQLSRKQSR